MLGNPHTDVGYLRGFLAQRRGVVRHDFGRERALREGDPPPLPERDTDGFEGSGEGSRAPGDLKSRVHPSKSLTCPQKATWSRLLHRWTSHTFLRSAPSPQMRFLGDVERFSPPGYPLPQRETDVLRLSGGDPFDPPGDETDDLGTPPTPAGGGGPLNRPPTCNIPHWKD